MANETFKAFTLEDSVAVSSDFEVVVHIDKKGIRFAKLKEVRFYLSYVVVSLEPVLKYVVVHEIVHIFTKRRQKDYPDNLFGV